MEAAASGGYARSSSDDGEHGVGLAVVLSDSAVVVAQHAVSDGGGGSSSSSSSSFEKYVRLNVGGLLYLTSVDTLLKQGASNYFGAMASGRIPVHRDQEGYILIDRDGRHFAAILNFMRDGKLLMPESEDVRAEILREAQFYLLDGLVDLIREHEHALAHRRHQAKVSVPVVTSAEEELAILSSTNLPVVKFAWNRNNNKYSYTPNSDDNLLKNIELFDKLAIKFNGRILFLKDTECSSDICTWSFYGMGKLVMEVCCSSLFYATDKKQSKIEFPEARILEGTLNVLLYEPAQIACMEGAPPHGTPIVPRRVASNRAYANAAMAMHAGGGGSPSAGAPPGAAVSPRSSTASMASVQGGTIVASATGALTFVPESARRPQRLSSAE